MDRTARPLPETTAPKAASALAAAAIVGAPAVGLVWGVHWILVALGRPSGGTGFADVIEWGLRIAAPAGLLGLVAAFIAFPAMVAGLFFLAGPIWALLHRCRIRNALAAMLLGGALVGGIATTLALLRWYPPSAAISLGLAQAIVGAALGLLVWRLAYR